MRSFATTAPGFAALTPLAAADFVADGAVAPPTAVPAAAPAGAVFPVLAGADGAAAPPTPLPAAPALIAAGAAADAGALAAAGFAFSATRAFGEYIKNTRNIFLRAPHPTQRVRLRIMLDAAHACTRTSYIRQKHKPLRPIPACPSRRPKTR